MKFLKNLEHNLDLLNWVRENIIILEEAFKLIITLLELSKILVNIFKNILDKKSYKFTFFITNIQVPIIIKELIENI